MGWLFIALCAAVICVLMWLLDPNLRRGRAFHAELALRESVPDGEMLRRYFAESEESSHIPREIRRIFAKHMGYPAEKLLPDDDFAFFWDELDMGDLAKEVEVGFSITFTVGDELTPCTIRAASAMVEAKRRAQTAI